MGRLILGDVVGPLAVLLDDLLRAHGLEDLCKLIREEAILLQLVLVKIHRNAGQGPAKSITVRRIEIHIDIAVAVHAAVHTGAWLQRTQVVVAHSLLPLHAPAGSSRRYR